MESPEIVCSISSSTIHPLNSPRQKFPPITYRKTYGKKNSTCHEMACGNPPDKISVFKNCPVTIHRAEGRERECSVTNGFLGQFFFFFFLLKRSITMTKRRFTVERDCEKENSLRPRNEKPRKRVWLSQYPWGDEGWSSQFLGKIRWRKSA